MAKLDRFPSRFSILAGGGILLLVLLIGGGLRLGMNVTPPEQVQVHKDLPSSLFVTQQGSAPALPAMPPVPAMAQPVVSSSASAAVTSGGVAPASTSPSTPLPTMPAPKTAPMQGSVAPAPNASTH